MARGGSKGEAKGRATCYVDLRGLRCGADALQAVPARLSARTRGSYLRCEGRPIAMRRRERVALSGSSRGPPRDQSGRLRHVRARAARAAARCLAWKTPMITDREPWHWPCEQTGGEDRNG